MLDLEEFEGRGDVPGEGRVAVVAAQERFDLDSLTRLGGVELGDDLAAAHDREVLAAVLDGIEQVGEVAGGVGGTDLRHEIRLSDPTDQNVGGADASPTRGRPPDRCRIGALG